MKQSASTDAGQVAAALLSHAQLSSHPHSVHEAAH
jgi:hypothetical protein